MKRLVLLLVTLVLPFSIMAAGDYVWEEKYQRQLPKAEQGDVKAQFDIGEMYASGLGVTRDINAAFEWYLKAALQGHVKAAYKTGYAYFKGQGTTVDTQQALHWLSFASEKDYERAHFYLAEMYEYGTGVEQDLNIALNEYNASERAGFEPAKARIQRVKTQIAERTQEQAEQARIREESHARKQLAEVSKPKVEAANPELQKVSMTTAPPTTADLILKGGWKNLNKPSEYLPSSITECKTTGKTIECLSTEQARNVGVVDVKYTTKSVVFGIKPNGEFKISYRNMITEVEITDPEFAESGEKAPLSKGWQDAEHALICVFEKDDELKCSKDRLRTIKLRR